MTENVWMCDAIVERDMVVGDRWCGRNHRAGHRHVRSPAVRQMREHVGWRGEVMWSLIKSQVTEVRLRPLHAFGCKRDTSRRSRTPSHRQSCMLHVDLLLPTRGSRSISRP